MKRGGGDEKGIRRMKEWRGAEVVKWKNDIRKGGGRCP